MIHPDSANISKAEIKEKLASLFKSKVEQIAVFGVKSKFGGGSSTGFALVYDSLDARKKLDQKRLLKRDGLIDKTKKITRKQGKEIKGRVRRCRGTAKTKAAASSGKKKKR